MRTLFDAGLAVYSQDIPENKTLHSIFLMSHVFLMNVVVLNYMIAILSTTYEQIKFSGTFRYKVNLYMYCEKFMISFKNGLSGELIKHSAPFSILTIILLPQIFGTKIINKYAILQKFNMSKLFSLMMFWVENAFFLTLFAIYEILIFPICYCKVFINLIRASFGLFTKFFFIFMWGVFGTPILILFIL